MDAWRRLKQAGDRALQSQLVGRRTLAADGDRLGTLLAALAPGTTQAAVETSSGPACVLVNETSHVVVMRLVPASGTSIDWPTRLPALPSLLAVNAAGKPVVGLQLVVRMMPLRMPLVGGMCAAARSAYLAVRIHDGAPDTVAGVIDWLVQRIASTGLRAEPLSHELPATCAALAGLDGFVVRADAPVLVRGIRTVRVGATAHACFRLDDRSVLTMPGQHLLARLSLNPALPLTIGVAARPAGTELAFEVVLRLSAGTEPALGAACDVLNREANGHQVRLIRLDTQHGDGLKATLPLGGGGGSRAQSWSYLAAPGALDGLTLWTGGAGVTLGADREGNRPVPLRLFDVQPTTLVVLGQPLAKFIALRAAATGATVTVRTTNAPVWHGPFQFAPSNAAVAELTTAGRSHLIVDDTDTDTDALSCPPCPRHSLLVVRHQLRPHDVPIMQRANATLLAALTPAERALAAAVFDAPFDDPVADPNTVAVVSGTTMCRVTPNPTSHELGLTGPLCRP